MSRIWKEREKYLFLRSKNNKIRRERYMKDLHKTLNNAVIGWLYRCEVLKVALNDAMILKKAHFFAQELYIERTERFKITMG